MSQEKDLLEYDEVDAIRFIRNYIPQEIKEKFSDDDMEYIIDLIYEFYEKEGYLDENRSDDEEVEIDLDELCDFVVKNAKKDEVGSFSAKEVAFVVEGEIAYCESIGMFD